MSPAQAAHAAHQALRLIAAYLPHAKLASLIAGQRDHRHELHSVATGKRTVGIEPEAESHRLRILAVAADWSCQPVLMTFRDCVSECGVTALDLLWVHRFSRWIAHVKEEQIPGAAPAKLFWKNCGSWSRLPIVLPSSDKSRRRCDLTGE